jgi:hypothetical protein
MSSQKILVPHNFTPYDQKSLEFVIRTFSHRKDVEVTLFNSYTSVPDIDTRSSPQMDSLQSNINYLSKKIKDQENLLKNATEKLIQSGFSETQVDYIFQPRKKDISAQIIALTKDKGFNLIVLNHKPGKLSHFFTGNIFSKVIKGLKDITVCVVS